MTLGPLGSFTVIVPGELAVMSRPGLYVPLEEDLRYLKERGVGAVVSLTEEPLDAQTLRRFELECLHEPVRDFAPPTQAQLDRIMEFVARRRVTCGDTVLVHCGAGLGRSGTVAAAWLVRAGMEPRAAIARVRQLRPMSVETAEQEAAVEAYARRLAGEGGQSPPPL